MSDAGTIHPSPEARRSLLTSLKPGRTAQNLRLVRQFQATHPNDAFANLLLAQTLVEAGDSAAAVGFAEAAVNLSRFDPPATSLLARLYQDFGFLEKMGPLLSEAVKRNPGAANLASDMGDYLTATGQAEAALAEYRRALALAPKGPFSSAVQRSIVDLLRSMNRQEDANTILRDMRQRKEDEAFAILRQSQAPSLGNSAELEEDLTKLLQDRNSSLEAREASSLWLALGNLLEKRGAHAEAFAAWQKARALYSPSYPREQITALVSRQTAFYKPELFAALRAFGSPNPSALFVVGMPRSGTTLLEQILSSHSKIGSAGELGRMGRRSPHFLELYDRPGGLEALKSNALRGELMARAREHVLLARLVAGSDFTYTIDKMPTQFLAAGYIHACLPQARFIYISRHPADTFISTYQNNFSADYSFAFDQSAYAHFHVQQERLMEHWLSVFPSQIFCITYEKLVANPKEVISECLNFLGLEWQDSCLSFNDAGNAIRTFSRNQVRNTINSSSIGRWRNYRPQIEPLFAAFAALGRPLDE